MDNEEEDLTTLLLLQQELKEENCRRKKIEDKLKLTDEEIKLVRCNAIHLQAKAEEEEEFITNNLLKRLEAVKKEKESLAKQVQIEEEFMTNNLQRKLQQLRKEKGELERHLEAEQEYFVNKLQKQLLEITRQKNALERKLNEGRSGLISQFERTVGDCKHSLHSKSCPQEWDSIATLEAQIAGMRDHQLQAESEANEYRERCEQYVKELEELTKEKGILDSQARTLKDKMERLQQEREAEFSQFELSEERRFNLSMRRASCDHSESDISKSISLRSTPLTSRDSSRSNSQLRRRPRCPSDLLPRTHSERERQLPHGPFRPAEVDPQVKTRPSNSSSNLTSPGHSASQTPTPMTSPMPWTNEVPVATSTRKPVAEEGGQSPSPPGPVSTSTQQQTAST